MNITNNVSLLLNKYLPIVDNTDIFWTSLEKDSRRLYSMAESENQKEIIFKCMELIELLAKEK